MHTEISRRLAYFTAQANANRGISGEAFTDVDMARTNGIRFTADLYIGSEDATIISVMFGESSLDPAAVAAAEAGRPDEAWVCECCRCGVDAYSVTLADTEEDVYALVESNDAYRRVTFYADAEDIINAYEAAVSGHSR
jgi:hypothetical protein